MKKKRTKKYRPREAKVPVYMFKVYPDLPEDALNELDLYGYVPLDAIAKGNGSIENVDYVMSALRAAYTLTAAFENKAEMQMLCYLATAGLAAAAGEMAAKEPVTEAYLDPARDVLQMLHEMHKQCKRDVLVKAMRATLEHRRNILNLAHGAAHIVDPKDPVWKHLLGVKGMAYVNGRGRTGYLEWNETMSRLDWVAPMDDITVPICGETIVVLEKPVVYEKEN